MGFETLDETVKHNNLENISQSKESNNILSHNAKMKPRHHLRWVEGLGWEEVVCCVRYYCLARA